VLHDLDEDPNDPEISTKMGEALEEHLEMLNGPLKRDTIFYRGRPGCAAQGQPYVGAAIGAPPAALAVPGRANRAGVSVLYLARNAETVAAELRARTANGPISICRVRPNRDLRVIDIVKGFPTINPFTSSEEHLGWTIEIAELLNLFSSELSWPVQLDDNPQQYRVTQQLCEAVRSAGYDGILYPSTRQERGKNLVVFDPALCRIGRSWLLP
jgi:RES domain-containing protein